LGGDAIVDVSERPYPDEISASDRKRALVPTVEDQRAAAGFFPIH
jgi:hypothetical protein